MNCELIFPLILTCLPESFPLLEIMKGRLPTSIKYSTDAPKSSRTDNNAKTGLLSRLGRPKKEIFPPQIAANGVKKRSVEPDSLQSIFPSLILNAPPIPRIMIFSSLFESISAPIDLQACSVASVSSHNRGPYIVLTPSASLQSVGNYD